MRKNLNLRTNIAVGLIFAFLANTFGPIPMAQADEFRLPAPGVMVHLSPEFNPPILKGIKIHPDNPFRFDFILDQGDSPQKQEQLKTESTKLIKYFLASLTIPEKDLWVNLSPYEKDRIIPQSFGLTEMGRDLLAEDYMLKQITASLIYPEGETGKKFWKRIYEEAYKKFGTTNIPVNTFNKVWIVPEKAMVYENAKAGTAYVVEAKLKVMLEEDYLSMSKHADGGVAERGKMRASSFSAPASAGFGEHAGETRGQDPDINKLGSDIVREIVIPELTKEVNEDKNFAQLRQVYNSLILATWYKKKIKDSILNQVYADKNKTAGVQYTSTVIPAKAPPLDGAPPKAVAGIQNKTDVELIYQRYLQAFKKGAYNYIKEEQDPITQQPIPRKYFSGGFDAALIAPLIDYVKMPALSSNSPNTVIVAASYQAVGKPWGIETEDGDFSDDFYKGHFQREADEAMMTGMDDPYKGSQLVDKIDQVRREVTFSSDHQKYITLLEAGIGILQGYQQYRTREGPTVTVKDYLSPQGQRLIRVFHDKLKALNSNDFSWDEREFEQYKDLLELIPTVARPNEDLFINVLEGYSERELKALASAGYNKGFSIKVTNSCSNQCTICQGSKENGLITSMPFPIVIKIFSKLQRYLTNVSTYLNTEPMDYYDQVVGATLVDLENWKKQHNPQYDQGPSFVTHGLGGQLSHRAREIVRQLPGKSITISFHLYHRPVVAFLQKMYQDGIKIENIPEAGRHLVDMYVARFSALIDGAFESGKRIRLRYYYADEIIGLLGKSNGSEAAFVMQGIAALQKKVWSEIGKKHPDFIPIKGWFIRDGEDREEDLREGRTAENLLEAMRKDGFSIPNEGEPKQIIKKLLQDREFGGELKAFLLKRRDEGRLSDEDLYVLKPVFRRLTIELLSPGKVNDIGVMIGVIYPHIVPNQFEGWWESRENRISEERLSSLDFDPHELGERLKAYGYVTSDGLVNEDLVQEGFSKDFKSAFRGWSKKNFQYLQSKLLTHPRRLIIGKDLIVWSNDATGMLRDLNVPPEIIAKVRGSFSIYDKSDITYVDTDGSVKKVKHTPDSWVTLNPPLKRVFTAKDQAMNADTESFMSNYSGSIYYPASGLDLKSLISLVHKFPKVSNFTFVDILNIGQNLELGLDVSSWPKELSRRAILIQGILWKKFHGLFDEISVKITNEKKKELLITLTFNHNDRLLSPQVQGRIVKIRYIIGDLFDFNENFDVIYVQGPGIGGVHSYFPDFWDKVDRQLTNGGYLLLSKLTNKPNSNAFIEKGYAFASHGFGAGMVIYQKNVDRAALSDLGGIDLTPANMNLQTKVDSSPTAQNDTGIQFHLDPAMLQQLQDAPGFVPVIINIQPLKNLSTFLELNDS